MIKFDCIVCSEKLEAPGSMARSQLECPSCGSLVRVPSKALAYYEEEVTQKEEDELVKYCTYCGGKNFAADRLCRRCSKPIDAFKLSNEKLKKIERFDEEETENEQKEVKKGRFGGTALRAAVVSIGDELTAGQVVDTNTAWLSERLAGLGIETFEQVTVGDDLEIIASHLHRLSRIVNVIIVNGGLGPTDDDLTRRALARVLDVKLQLHHESWEYIRQFFAKLDREASSSNRIQAMIPIGCNAIHNRCGTAPGIVAKIDHAAAFFMPGVPREMQAMFVSDVTKAITQIAAHYETSQALATGSLHLIGLGESNMADLMGDLMNRGRNPLINSTVAEGLIKLRVSARAKDAATANQMVEATCNELRSRLGEYIFSSGDESLAEIVGRLLNAAGKTLAVAESCTGGLLAKDITDIPGSSNYFIAGLTTYSNTAKVKILNVDAETLKVHGAVSEETAAAMARNVRELTGADYALSTTGIAGPGGGGGRKPVGLVYIALADKDDVTVVRKRFHDDRRMTRRWSVNTALDMLRRELLKPGGDAVNSVT